MVEIPNGAVATYKGVWSISTGIGVVLNSGLPAAADIVSMVGAELKFDGLTITSSNIDGESSYNWGVSNSFSPTLQILNQSGQELDDSDLVAQIADAVNGLSEGYQGQHVSGGVTQVVAPDTGSNAGRGTVITTPTGVAAATMTPAKSTVHQCGDPTWGFFDDPAQYIQCLTSKGLTTVGLLAIGLLAGVVLIVAAKNRP
jgi:hypothetical protein